MATQVENEIARIRAEHEANLKKARESLEHSQAKAQKDYDLLVADYEVMCDARIRALGRQSE